MKSASAIRSVLKSHDFAAPRTLRIMSVIAVGQLSSCVARVVQTSMNGTVENLDSGLRL